MPSWSDFHKPQRDRPAELMARSILTSLKIPFKCYVTFQRPEYRCTICTNRIFDDLYTASAHQSTALHFCEAMTYEVDILAWKHDAFEFDGKVHLKGKGPRHDAERDAFLQSLGLVIHRWPNECILKHPEVFEHYARNLKELRNLE